VKFVTFVLGIVAIGIAAAVLVLTGHSDAGWIVGNLGTLLYMAAVMVWVATYDSRSRWPDTTAWQRFSYVITFKR
jgi:hypothetical protein